MEHGPAMSRTVCAIDLTSRSVQVLVRRRSGDIEAADFPLPAEALHDGKVLQPPAVQHYLARLMRVLKLRRGRGAVPRSFLPPPAQRLAPSPPPPPGPPRPPPPRSA